MTLITDNDSLAAFCGGLAGADFITVDTEFMREKTYWPILCLIQIAGPDSAAAIDPLAPGIDLSPILELLNNKLILKVFHAARQDIEIFFRLTGQVPAPLFDTQVAAMVCGFGEAASYETLAAKLAGAATKLQAVPGLVKLVSRAEIESHDWSLTPGRYVGVAPEEVDDDFDFEETMRAIHIDLRGLNEEAVQLAARIAKNFEDLSA